MEQTTATTTANPGVITMSATRLLREIKTIDETLGAISSQPMTFIQKGDVKKEILNSPGSNPEAAEKQTQSVFDRMKDKLRLRRIYKAALVQSNAQTEVTIGNKTMTVAEAIEMKTWVNVWSTAIQQQKTSLQNQSNMVTHGNNAVDLQISKTLEQVYTRDKKDLISNEDRKAIEDSINGQSRLSLKDPHKIGEFLESQMQEIQAFKNEVDFTLSEINAKTEITISV